MPRYFIQLAYNGKAYHGWQIQPNAISVQEVLNNALSTICRTEINVTGAGRTDTGVHASFFVAHFEMDDEIENTEKLSYKLNRFLPDDIEVATLFMVNESMHARFDALSRTYHYFISNSKELFRKDFVSFVPYTLDVDLMNEAAQELLKFSDFTSFSKLHTDVKTNICDLQKAAWSQNNGLLVFEVRADRFLRNMVRAMVGTLIEVGRGAMSIKELNAILEAKDRNKAGASAEAKGLFLSNIIYPESIDNRFLRREVLNGLLL